MKPSPHAVGKQEVTERVPLRRGNRTKRCTVRNPFPVSNWGALRLVQKKTCGWFTRASPRLLFVAAQAVGILQTLWVLGRWAEYEVNVGFAYVDGRGSRPPFRPEGEGEGVETSSLSKIIFLLTKEDNIFVIISSPIFFQKNRANHNVGPFPQKFSGAFF